MADGRVGRLMIIFVILGIGIAVKTPAWESSDEPGHVEDIETLVSGHWYGMSSTCQPALGSPLYIPARATRPSRAALLRSHGGMAEAG